MSKVRFSCPRCQTVMQTNEDKIGFDIACPHCTYRFKLIEPSPTQSPRSTEEATMPPKASPVTSPLAAGSKSSAGSTVRTSALQSETHQSNLPTGVPHVGGRFQCPYCQTNSPPKMKSEINTVGWIVFGVLLVTTCIFCWIGFLIRDNFKVCSNCNIRL